MFEDKVIQETEYGRLVRFRGVDRLLITGEGEKFLENYCRDEEEFESWIQCMCKKVPENAFLVRLGPREHHVIDIEALQEHDRLEGLIPDLMFRLATWTHFTGENHYGAVMEIVTLAEIQRYMAERGNEGKRYEFVPHKLYFGTEAFLITEWIEGRTWSRLEINEYPELYEVMEEFVEDLRGTGLHLDTADGNFFYLGKNEESGKPKFAVIDQLDTKLVEKLD